MIASRNACRAVGAMLLATLAPCAIANDYPTLDRIQYVEACIRNHPQRPRQEMLYKCSCAIDVIAADLSYAEYVDASTAAYAGQIAGERGTGIRESDQGQGLSKRFRAAEAKALASCLIEQ